MKQQVLILGMCAVAGLAFGAWLHRADSAPDASNACVPGELRADSTLHSLGFEWDITGDANHNATCQVAYRPKGERTWKEGLPLFRTDFYGWYGNTRADRPYNMLAGSILFLKPGTTYEVRLTLRDPDGGAATKTLTLATRPVPRLAGGGRTWHVVPGEGGGRGTKNDPFRGIAAAQRVAQPGDVFLLHGGNYGEADFTTPGKPGRYVAWKAAGDGPAVLQRARVEGSHLWLEGLTFRRESGDGPGLNARGPVTDVVVRRCSFSGFHYSINLNRQASYWYIADNVMVGDNDPDSGSISGEGVELNHSSGHTVCYNRISRTADAISYPHRNCDLFGNDIFDVSDDGLEPDYGYANVRMWGNRITNVHNNALSFQPMYCGPWYFIRNQVVCQASIFKFRVQDRFVLVNNTFVRWGAASNRMHHILTSLSRNNLYISAGGREPIWVAYDCREPQYCLPNVYTPGWKTDVDYDGFDWGDSPQAFRWENTKFFPDLRAFADAVGIEQHALRVRKEEIFKDYRLPPEPTRVQPMHLTLKPGCNAVDSGAVVPNLNEDFVGKAPDLGAHELGAPLAHYGPREE